MTSSLTTHKSNFVDWKGLKRWLLFVLAMTILTTTAILAFKATPIVVSDPNEILTMRCTKEGNGSRHNLFILGNLRNTQKDERACDMDIMAFYFASWVTSTKEDMMSEDFGMSEQEADTAIENMTNALKKP